MSLILDTIIDSNEQRVTTKIQNSRSKGGPDTYDAHVYGTFDSGTVTAQISPDGGTTWIDYTDSTGNTVTFTSDDAKKITANSDYQNPVQIGFRITGSSSPSVNVRVFDNR